MGAKLLNKPISKLIAEINNNEDGRDFLIPFQ